MKKSLSLFLSFTLLLPVLTMSFVAPAVAATVVTSPVIYQNGVTVEEIPYDERYGDGDIDLLRESLARGTSRPSSQWNWGNGIYEGELISIQSSTLYTNYTFQPNTDGWIILSGTFFRHALGPNLDIVATLYRADNNNAVGSATYPTGYYDDDDPGRAFRWNGLDPNKTYYYSFYVYRPGGGLANSASGPLHVRIVP